MGNMRVKLFSSITHIIDKILENSMAPFSQMKYILSYFISVYSKMKQHIVKNRYFSC